MKRFTLLLLSIMTLETYAQSPSPMTISTNFTVDYGTGYPKGEQVLFEPDNYNINVTEITGVWTAGTTEDKATYKVIENPAQSGINTSAKCLEVTCRNNDGSIGINFENILGYTPNLNGRRRISMLFKAGKNGETPLGNDYYTQLQLETNYGTDGNQVYCLGAYYDATDDNSGAGHDGWKRLYFDFTPYNTTDNSYHTKVIGDSPFQLVFKPKICKVTLASDNRTIESYEPHTCSPDDVYYIDDIKIEDVPYAEGYWINDDTNLPKGEKKWNDAEQRDEWNTASCALPTSTSNGVLHLSGTWLKGENLVNPEKGKDGTWVYEFNEYRDLSWHVKPEEVKLMVFHKDSKLRWGDRGGLLGTNTAGDVAQGYPDRFIKNLNVLIFAEKSCILPDEVDNLAANWHDTNAVIHYSNDNSWKAWELELTDDYPFLNPQEFTVEHLIKIHREMKEGFNTIIYPFSLTAEEIRSSRVGTFYHHNADDIVYFIPTDATEANVPFVTENFSPLFEEGGINVTKVFQQFDGERTISACSDTEEYRQLSANQKGLDYHSWSLDDANYNLVGTYHRISGEGKWGIATTGTYGNSDYQQTFKKGGSRSSFKPFRAYLDIPESQGAAKFAALSIADFTDDSTITGISQDVVALPSGRQDVYTLSGIRIKAAATAEELINLPKGVYIINGKKQFVR